MVLDWMIFEEELSKMQSQADVVNARDNPNSGNASVAMKRYNLSIPQALFDEIQHIADGKGITVLEVFRKFIRLGLIAHELETKEDAHLIIREGERETEILLV